jgi:pSer/pThr/pTyr-binding forkhead associated (FHA) protein
VAKPVKCSRCGRENDTAFAYCLDCGQVLRPLAPAAGPAERICAGCGAKVAPGFKFCGHCGRPVDPPAAPAVPAGGTPVHLGGTAPAPPGPRPGVPGPPAAPPPPGPRLALVRHDGLPGAWFALSREVTVCGRTAGEVLLPEDPTVSPRQAAFTVRDGRVHVEDLGSVNGTFLRLRAPRTLALGDEVRIGRQLLRLETLPREAVPGNDVAPWGSPDPGYRVRFAQLLEGGGIGEMFPLRAGENLVGREVGDLTFPADRYVSGRHARVDVGEGGVTITDLGSSNGTFVKVGAAVELNPGDQVLVGMQLLRLET